MNQLRSMAFKMNQRKTPYGNRSALARVWLVARSLRVKPMQTATDLSRDLEVSTKTIYRDLDFLRDRLRHHIVYDPHNHGWFYQSIPLLTYL
jgi:hypothetical protein